MLVETQKSLKINKMGVFFGSSKNGCPGPHRARVTSADTKIQTQTSQIQVQTSKIQVHTPKIQVLSSSMVHPWHGSIIPSLHSPIGGMAVLAGMLHFKEEHDFMSNKSFRTPPRTGWIHKADEVHHGCYSQVKVSWGVWICSIYIGSLQGSLLAP